MSLTSTAPSCLDLPAAHRAIREEARSRAAEFAPRAREIRDHLLEHRAMHPQLWQVFREQGWCARTPGPAERGGLLATAIVLEAFAEQGIVLWMPVLTAAIAHAIALVGPDSARETWLPLVADGRVHLAMAATEPETGHNVFASRTEIRRTDEGFVVRGSKRVTSGLDVAERVLVLGRAYDGEQATGYTTLLIDPRSRGATITEVPMRFREGVRQFELELDDVTVPADALVGRHGAGLFTLWPFTSVERVLTAALCVGSAAYAVDRSVARAKERVIAGGTPIGAHQAVSHPLARLSARLTATRLLVHRTAARSDAGADIAGDANAAKVLAADLAFDAADHAVQVFGADAWDERNGWLDHYLDARLARSGPVSNEFALNHLAEHTLGLPAHR
ncbi:acyl-CoA dehydrogenase family protein [Nocardia sp. NPDC057227]|uniref:acyl-CoA dehydrogenase family protein n=1 Tax=Nocardia sp. NPDC057227 TaxID=3346056 RepID=UPI0036438B53